MSENDEHQKHGCHVWDGLSLSAYIKNAYGTDIGVRQCQRLLHSLGFSLIRPRIFPSKGKENTEERVVYKKILELKEDKSMVWTFQDEAVFQVTTSVTRKWSLKGSKLQIESVPERKKRHTAALSIRTQEN